MKHTTEIDGKRRHIDIRPMDESLIVFRKMYVPPITRENLGTGTPDDPPCLAEFLRTDAPHIIEQFLRKQIGAIGSCAILAWEGDAVVGKMYFTTREMWDAFRQDDSWMCVEHESMPRMIQSLSDERITSLLASPTRTLYIQCFNIGHFDARYHGKGIASAMLHELKQWAKANGWRRLEIKSCPDVVPFWALGPNVLRRSALARRGFQVAEEVVCPPNEATFRRKAIFRILRGQFEDDDWDVKTYPDNIAYVKRIAETSNWEALFDRDFVMACDLQAVNQQEQIV